MRFWNQDPDQTLFSLMDQSVRGARLRFVLPGRTVDVGSSATAKEDADFIIQVSNPHLSRRVLTQGNLGLGESFMEGGWSLQKGNLEGLLTVLASSNIEEQLRADPRVLLAVAAMRVQHLFTGARANIELHYDLGDEVYDLFLGSTKAYTCGYQKHPDESLDQIQKNKFDRILQKLQIKPGQTLCDLGCGFGGLLMHAAQHYGVRGYGVSISKAQVDSGLHRIKELGLTDMVKLDYGDFRSARGVYDRVVSVGMFEHLYPHQYAGYFTLVRNLMNEDGISLVHTMGCITEKNHQDPFIQKYLFPGSTHALLSDITRQLERHRLPILDVENIGRHYLPTVQAWLRNFRANQHRLDRQRYDARFQRMFEYYLCMCVAAIEAAIGAVYQVLFTKNYRKHLPFYRV